MFAAISARITQKFEANQTIKSEDRDVYQYGVQQGLTILLNLATTVAIGFICGMLWQSVLFTAACIPLRSFAGGYHAKTPNRCYVFSIFMITAALLVMRYVPVTNHICGIIILISGLFLVLLAPVADNNKPLDRLERQVYRKRALLIGGIEAAVAVICFALGWRQLDRSKRVGQNHAHEMYLRIRLSQHGGNHRCGQTHRQGLRFSGKRGHYHQNTGVYSVLFGLQKSEAACRP